MKVTDYAPRAAPFDSHLKGRDLIGVEVGVDVGAHAEALLTYCPVGFLHLVDIWPNPYCHGYCEGRLARFRPRWRIVSKGSLGAAEVFAVDGKMLAGTSSWPPFDFVYIDQEHGGESVAADLDAWWPLLKRGGVLGYRNYNGRGTPLDLAVDAFVARARPAVHIEDNEIILLKA